MKSVGDGVLKGGRERWPCCVEVEVYCFFFFFFSHENIMWLGENIMQLTLGFWIKSKDYEERLF